MDVITMLNQKGGVGKTSTCFHLAGTLAAMGRRVLLVDNDPQASLSQGFWGPVAARQVDPAATVAAIYRGDRPWPDDLARPTGVPGVDLVPGSRDASDYNVPRPHEADEDAQVSMRMFLSEAEGYDLALIDCPPNLHLCSWAALVASEWLVVPTQPEDFGAQGLRDVQESASLVRSLQNPALALLGYLLTRVGARKAIHQVYEDTLRAQYGPDVFDARVMDATGYIESIAARKPVAQHRPKSAPAKSMLALAGELLSRIEARRASRSGSEVAPRAEVA